MPPKSKSGGKKEGAGGGGKKGNKDEGSGEAKTIKGGTSVKVSIFAKINYFYLFGI